MPGGTFRSYGASYLESWPGLSRLVPAIHVFQLKARKKDADARDKRGQTQELSVRKEDGDARQDGIPAA